LIGARLGETVLAAVGLFTDVELLASGELYATSEVFASGELAQADSAMIANPSGVARTDDPEARNAEWALRLERCQGVRAGGAAFRGTLCL
jgi:hypothetical protein